MTADEFAECYGRLPVAFLLATSGGVIEAVNGRCAELLETDAAVLTGTPIERLATDDPHKVRRYLQLCSGSRDFLPGALQFHVNGGSAHIDVRANGATAGDGGRKVLLHLAPRAESHRRFTALNQKIEELAVEVEERRRTEALLVAQNDALGMIARDEPLGEVLQRITEIFGRPAGIRVLILPADDSGRLRMGAAMPLPAEWRAAVESIVAAIGAVAEAIVSSDLAADPRWPEVHDIARKTGLRSCWVFPVTSSDGERVGVVALLGANPGEPGEREWRLSRIATGTAAIAIERYRSRERLAGVLQRQMAMLDGLPARIALIEKTGQIRSVNSAWLSWVNEMHLPLHRFGAGANLLDWCDSIFAPSVSASVRAVVDGSSAAYDTECRCGDGEEPGWVRLTVAPATRESATPRDVILMHLDITDRRKAENHLLTQAAELTRANAELQQFAYIASHDLREPLRNVKSFSQLLVRRFGSVVNEDAVHLMKYVTDGVTRMEELIDDLLLYSRVVHEGQVEHPGPLPISQAVASAIRNLDAAIQESGARICVGELPVVVGHRTQLTQLFQNLIANGIKYRGTERPVIEIDSHPGDGGTIISVADNGIGIARQYHETIFGLFKRLHARDVPGTGIGLALCRKIAEMHGGEVWVESEPGRGSRFYVKLPNRAGHASTN